MSSANTDIRPQHSSTAADLLLQVQHNVTMIKPIIQHALGLTRPLEPQDVCTFCRLNPADLEHVIQAMRINIGNWAYFVGYPRTHIHADESADVNIDFVILAALFTQVFTQSRRQDETALDQALRISSLGRHNARLVDRDVRHAAEHASLMKRVSKLQGKGRLREFGRKILGLFRRRSNDDVCSSY